MDGLESFFTASQQLRLFVLSCAFGIPIGILFDIFRVIRMFFPHGKILVAAEDILFFIFYGIFLVCFTITAARSEFRFYFCAGNFLGFILYHFTLGNAVSSAIKKTVMVIKKGLYIILRPVSRKIVLLCEKYTAFFVGSFKNIKLKKKNTETPLKVRHDLVYNNKVHKKSKRKNVKKVEKKTG